jgi:hypothetical protein
MEDNGLPDPVKLDAEEIAVERLPNDTLIFMLGSRYCETDKLSDIALAIVRVQPSRLAAGSGYLRFRLQPSDFWLSICPRHSHRI